MREFSAISMAVVISAMLLPLVICDSQDNEIGEYFEDRPVKTCEPCGPGECLVIGMQRYSVPECKSLGQQGDFCRMYDEPENRTLSFPTETLECADVWTQFCPCGRGLTCRDAICETNKPRRNSRYPWLRMARFH